MSAMIRFLSVSIPVMNVFHRYLNKSLFLYTRPTSLKSARNQVYRTVHEMQYNNASMYCMHRYCE